VRIVCVDGVREWDVEVRLGRPDATLVDLAAAVGMAGSVLAVVGMGECVDHPLTVQALVSRPPEVGRP
jgi:hypothetical protein